MVFVFIKALVSMAFPVMRFYISLYIVNANAKISWFGGRGSSVGKSSAYQSGYLGSNPGVGLTRVTQCMNERGRECQLQKSYCIS